MQVLMVLFADRGKDHYTSGSRTQLAHRIRYKSEKWVFDTINNLDDLEREVALLNISPENKTLFNSWTPPLDFVDLIGEETRLEFARAKSPQDKREKSMIILKKYFMRNFEMDEKLMDLYNEIEGLSVDQLISALKIRGVLLKLIWKKGKEGPRFLPVDIPITDFRNQKPTQPQQEDKASKKQRKKQSKPEEEEDLSSKNSYGDLTGYDDEDPTKLEMPKPPTPKPVQEEKLSVAEAAERFKIGIENPNSSIEMDQNKLRTLGEEELRDYLSQVLTPYLFEHYSDNAETLLAKIMEMNNFGIVDMIKTENELSQLAKSMGIYPADRFNKDSPLKVRGNPLSSNVHRVYELRCTKAEVGRATVSTMMPMVLGNSFHSFHLWEGTQ
jgi:hypothetical protein